MNTLYRKQPISCLGLSLLILLIPTTGISQTRVTDSTKLSQIAEMTRKAKRQERVSYVDVDDKNCVDLPTPKYVIVAGNGGTNMDLRCPPDHPIMREWRQRLGFGGFLWVSSGGGYATGKCCAMKSKWTTAS